MNNLEQRLLEYARSHAEAKEKSEAFADKFSKELDEVVEAYAKANNIKKDQFFGTYDIDVSKTGEHKYLREEAFKNCIKEYEERTRARRHFGAVKAGLLRTGQKLMKEAENA